MSRHRSRVNCAKVRVSARCCGRSERVRETGSWAGKGLRLCCKFRTLADKVWGRLIVDAEPVRSAVRGEQGQRNRLTWLHCQSWSRLAYRRRRSSPTSRGDAAVKSEGSPSCRMWNNDLRNWKSRRVDGGQENDRENQPESLKLLQRTVPSYLTKITLTPEYLPMPEINTNLTLMY